MSLPDFQVFANRLQKMARHFGKWARRQGISCYRVYDADVPEFPLAVDVYENCLHAAEYQREESPDPELRRLWRSLCRQTMSEVFGIPQDRIFYKERQPQKGNQQYEKVGERRHEQTVQEGGLKFIVNLSDYLDTGLFLDHRLTRSMVRERANERHMLNLFAYTGSFSVYAAAGGALSTTTIDLSNTYLEWAGRNLALNGFEGPEHRLIRADVKAWLNEAPKEERYDLVVLDPPTFSNSKRMRDILDTQRDHAFLINACLDRMKPGGLLYFSTNFRRFRLELEAIHSQSVRDITAQTIPPDFRNQRIHYCFEIGKA